MYNQSTHLERAETADFSKFKVAFILFVCLLGIMWTSLKNYLLFHSIIELFCVIIAFTCFIIVITTQKFNSDQESFILLGILYGFTGAIDLLHTLAYQGMGVFSANTANIATQLWIAGRYLESISLFFTCICLHLKFKISRVVYLYTAVTLLIILSIFVWNIFPDCYIQGVGLTSFKKASELIICLFLLGAICVLHRNKKHFNKTLFHFLLLSIATTIISESAFILYIDVYGIMNAAGHIVKLGSYYFIYKGIIEIGMKMPYWQLEHREKNYYQFIQSLPEAVIVHCEGSIVFSNIAALKLLRVQQPHEIIGSSIYNIVSYKYKNMLEQVDPQPDEITGALPTMEQSITRADGTMLELEVKPAPYIFEGKPAVLVILRDISERKKTEKLREELAEEERKRKETIEYDILKTRFFSNMSHEFKTPLNVILATIQLLEKASADEALANIVQNSGKHLKVMKQNCYRLLRLMNNIIDLTRIDAGFIKTKMANHNIVSLVEDIVMSVADYIHSKGIQLIFDTEMEEKIIACDPDNMERAILNLLSNAIKFTDRTGMITVNIYDGEDRIKISVKDTGIGIPKEKQEMIFERFAQVDQSLSRNHEGSGIGLSLVKSIVEIHGGSITLHSEEGAGSEFIIELPLRIVEETEENDDNTGNVRKIQVEKINIEFSDIYNTNVV